nr:DUF6766 family protein [Sphingobium sp. 15-1]
MLMRWLRNNGLTLLLLLCFSLSILGQWLTGWRVEMEDAARHGSLAESLLAYAGSPEFLSSVFENWESEFLQMSAYVILTAVFYQRGSAESMDPGSPPRDADLDLHARKPGAPGILRWGRLWRALYARSLGIALTLLFLLSFFGHWLQSAHAAARDAAEHGEIAPTAFNHLADPQLWFESFQNWQSEFLSTAVLVILSVFLRQRESPESKPVAAPHSQTGN